MELKSFWFSRLGEGFLLAILAKGSNTDWTTYHKGQFWKFLKLANAAIPILLWEIMIND